jgi:hypothetical protein
MALCPHCHRYVRRAWRSTTAPLYEHENFDVCGGQEGPPRLSAAQLAPIRKLARGTLPADRAVSLVKDAALTLLQHLRALRRFRDDLSGYCVIWIGRWLEFKRTTQELAAAQIQLQRLYEEIGERVGEASVALPSPTPNGEARAPIRRLRRLLSSPWPKLHVPPPPTCGASPRGLSQDEANEILARARELKTKPCPHCGRGVKNVSFRYDGHVVSYVFTHEDRRLCGANEPRVFLNPDELASIEQEADGLAQPRDAARFARSRLNVLLDELVDLQVLVDRYAAEAAGWLELAHAAAREYVQRGRCLPSAEIQRAVATRRRLLDACRLLKDVRLTRSFPGAERDHLVRLECALADLADRLCIRRPAPESLRRRPPRR